MLTLQPENKFSSTTKKKLVILENISSYFYHYYTLCLRKILYNTSIIMLMYVNLQNELFCIRTCPPICVFSCTLTQQCFVNKQYQLLMYDTASLQHLCPSILTKCPISHTSALYAACCSIDTNKK